MLRHEISLLVVDLDNDSFCLNVSWAVMNMPGCAYARLGVDNVEKSIIKCF